MLIFIAFLIVMSACINWLMIGLLQYDFIAGIFGYQGSVFSRLVYIVFGAAAVFLLIKVLTQKGQISVFNFKRKEKRRKEALESESSHEVNYVPRHHGGYDSEDGRNRDNSEAGRDLGYSQKHYEDDDFDRNEYNSLFDEHFSNDEWFLFAFLFLKC